MTNFGEVGRVEIPINVPFARARNDLRRVESRTQRMSGRVAVTMARMASRIALAFKAAASAAVGAVVTIGARFESEMTKSLAIMGDVGDEMQARMERVARNVARTTTFSANEAAEAYFFLASAGMDAAEQVRALPSVARFAQAGMFDLARATDIATDAQSALGLRSGDTEENLRQLNRVTDVLVKSNTLANASVEQFGRTLIGKLGPAARTAGVEIEEIGALMAVMADQGVKAEQASTDLAALFEMLPQVMARNKEEWGGLSSIVFDSQGQFRNMADVVQGLTEAFGDLTPQQRAAEFQALGINRRLVTLISQLMGTSEQIREYEEALRDAAGTSAEVASNQLEAFTEQVGLVRSEIADLALEIFNETEPALRRLIDITRKGVLGLRFMLRRAQGEQLDVDMIADLFAIDFPESPDRDREDPDPDPEDRAKDSLGALADLFGDMSEGAGEAADSVEALRQQALSIRDAVRPIDALRREFEQLKELAEVSPDVLTPDVMEDAMAQALERLTDVQIRYIANNQDILNQLPEIVRENVLLNDSLLRGEELLERRREIERILEEERQLTHDNQQDRHREMTEILREQERQEREALRARMEQIREIENAWRDVQAGGRQVARMGRLLESEMTTSLGNIIDSTGELGGAIYETQQNLEAFRQAESSIRVATTAMNVFASSAQAAAAAVQLVLDVIEMIGSSSEEELSEVDRILDELDSKLDDWARSLTDTIVGVIREGRFEIEDLVDSILEDISRVLIHETISRPLADAVRGAFAKGAAFRGGHVVPFATGGVVSGATAFPLKQGVGVMGESGPEAVMPLKRGPQGRLGVESTHPRVNIQIIDQSGQRHAFRQTTERGRDGEVRTKIIIRDAVRDLLHEGEFARDFRDLYNLRTEVNE